MSIFEQGALVWLLLLVLVSAFFSASETAFMVVNRYRLSHQAKQGSKQAQRVLDELAVPDRLLSVILFINTVANYLIASLATLVFVNWLGEGYLFLQSIVSATLLLMMAELIPKSFAACYPERLVYLASRVIGFLRIFLYPIVVAMKAINRSVLKLFGGVQLDAMGKPSVTTEDIRGVIGMVDQSMNFESHDMLKGVLNLEDLTVNDVMIPRGDMRVLDIMMPWDELKKSLADLNFSRVLIYSRELDNLVGIACKKTLYSMFSKGAVNRSLFISVLEPIQYIPEGTPLQIQLKTFRQNRYTLGVVVDEYGVILGIVTLADIVDEVIKGFSGEQARRSIINLGHGVFEVAGNIPIRDFNHISRWDLPTGGPVTISGLVIETLENLPKGSVCVEIEGYHIEVISMDVQKIERVKVSKGDNQGF
ncbi:CNNM domain-containing protein [Gammaproteobacteria bacterium]|nr:CNNM domain-containing protein [Gammaproteobacteria bacterium]